MSVRLKTCFFLCTMIFLADLSTASEDNGTAPPEVWNVREAVNFAISHNPDSTIASQRLVAARAGIVMAKAAFYPQLDFSSRYSQTDNPMYSFGNILNQGAFNPGIDFNAPGRTDNLNTGVRLSYRLYNGGIDQAAIEAAKAGEDAAIMTLGAVKDQLAFATVKSFNLIIQAEEIIKVHSAALKESDALLAVAKARYNEGILLKAELLNLEVHQSGSQENLLKAKNGLEVARKIFLNLLGLATGKVVIDPDKGNTQKLPENSSPEQRYAIRNARAMIRSAEARLRQARGGSYPVIEGYAGYDYDQGWEMDGDGDSWQAGVQLRYNLFDGHRNSAAVARAAAMLAEAKEQLHKINLTISLEIKQAELALDDATTRLGVTKKTVEQASESARITRARFKEGEVLSSDLIAVENRLTDARLRRNVAETARRIAVADLRRAFGLPQFTGPRPEADPDNNHQDKS